MRFPRHIKSVAPFMALALLWPKANAATLASSHGDEAVLTGQKLTWELPPAPPAAVAKVAAVHKAKSRKKAVKLTDLIAHGPVTFESLIASDGGEAPLVTQPKAAATNNAVAVAPSPAATATSQAAADAAAVMAALSSPEPAPTVERTGKNTAVVRMPAARGDDAASSTLMIVGTANGLVFSPEALTLPVDGGRVELKIAGEGTSSLQLFVRDAKIARLDAGGRELQAGAAGVTELYAVANGHMYIVPLTVAGAAAAKMPTLSVPQALVSLDGVVAERLSNANFPGVAKAVSAEAAATANPGPDATAAADGASVAALDAAADLPSLRLAEGAALEPAAGLAEGVDSAQVLASAKGSTNAPSLRASVAETAASLVRQAQTAARFYNAKDKVGYTSTTIQLVDERSLPESGLIYPAGGVSVRVLGTEFVAQTDATGHLTIRDMPQHSHFLLRIDDPSGQYRAAIAEITTATKAESVTRVRVMRSFAFDTQSAIAGSVQQSTRGSYCSSVIERSATDGKAQSVAGVSMQLDVDAEGPYFFNNYGFLDRTMRATGANGRFCFYNVAPGPMAMTIARGSTLLGTLPLSIFANRHVEDDIDIGAQSSLATRLASMPPAQEQLSNDPHAATAFQQVDMIDLLPLGTDTVMSQVAPGRVALPDPLLEHGGRLRAFARAAEFEPVVYTYRAGDDQAVTPLIPRGFIEDMSLYAQVVHDPQQGSVVAEYAAPQGATQETIAMRLVDQDGHDVGDGWYYSDAPATRAIFFNVPAGTYSLQVQTKDGYWLNSDTVIVYDETVSFMRLGSALRYRAP